MKLIRYILNLPWTLIGFFLAIISVPKRIRFAKDAIVFDVRSFWWANLVWYMKSNQVRGITNGNVISLGPLVEEFDLAHELVHVQQYMRQPFIYPFLYAVEVMKHGATPENKFEHEAYSTTGSVYRGESIVKDSPATSASDSNTPNHEKDINSQRGSGWSRRPEWWTVLIAIIALIISGLSAWYSYDSLTNENALNRPYLNIDASKMEMQLHQHQSDPKTALANLESGAPLPWVGSFSFDMNNIGKLPARYYVDLSGFTSMTPGTTTILEPAENTGVIFPGQTITLTYDIQGIESSDEAAVKQVITNLHSPSQIKVLYGYMDSLNPEFETIIDEESVQQNCDTIPTPGETCYPASWVVRAIK